MAPADNPSPVTPAGAPSTATKPAEAVQTTQVKPLPPPRQPPSPELLAWRLGQLDGLLVALVLAFAFLSALFPAHNSDFFLHAATGRLISHWQYDIGHDPFAFTTAGAYWVNPSWLYDLIVYLIYDRVPFGDTVLIVLKALMVAALAEAMLRTARPPGRPLWIPACCVALAVLVASTRVLLQPTCVSFVFLGLTFWLLHLPRQRRARAAAAQVGPPPRPFLPYWLIPPLCLLWVNLDAWFFLGPVLVALFLAGETLQGWLAPAKEGPDAGAPGERRTLLLVLLASVAACLVNPHHVWIFALPSQLGLSEAADALHDDSQFRGLFIRPFEDLYFRTDTGLSVAGLAFFALALLGLVSFAAAQWMGCWRWGRAIVWTAFFALAVWRASAIPFFAVVAGPITSLNFLDFAAKCFGTAPLVKGRAGTWMLGGRVLTLAAAVALLVATWPGWLQAQQGPPQQWRRVGWTVEPEPALKMLAEQITAWRREGLIEQDAHWFNTVPQTLPYLAWYCPGERAFIDNQRLGLYDQATAADYAVVRKSLAYVSGDAGAQEPRWRSLLRLHGVHLVVWYEGRLQPASPLPTFFAMGREWPVLYLNGRAAVFGWRDPSAGDRADPFLRLERNAEREAFGADVVPAPQGPAPEPQPTEWWAALWTPERPRPPDGDEAAVQCIRFQALRPPYFERYDAEHVNYYRSTLGAAGACIGAGGPLQGLLPSLYGDVVVEDRFALVSQKMDLGPPAPLYLSIRAARRALAVNADDAATYQFLAQAYNLLTDYTRAGIRERAVAYARLDEANRPRGDPFPLVLKRVQIATALRRALELDPKDAEAEKLAFQIYGEMGFNDLAYAHGEQYLQILKDNGKTEKELSDLMDGQKRLKDFVGRQNDTYLLKAANKSVLEKVKTALELHLAQQALDELTKVEWKSFDETTKPIALLRELSLKLLTGRADEVGKLLADPTEGKDLKEALSAFPDPDVGLPAYDWLSLEVAAATGDYAAADDCLKRLQERMGQADARAATALLLGQLVLRPAPAATGAAWLPLPQLSDARDVLAAAVPVLVEPLSRAADLEAMRGWLKLESGDLAGAREHFLTAQAMAPADQIPFRARGLAELGLEWLDSGR
jgi:tetratricopeptide (TPR) repeat protein